jgi:hypothetical protein
VLVQAMLWAATVVAIAKAPTVSAWTWLPREVSVRRANGIADRDRCDRPWREAIAVELIAPLRTQVVRSGSRAL